MAEEKFRVVAVDDDKDILHLVHLTLDVDHEVITICDSSKALGALDYLEADFLLLDIMMPKVTGYHILEDLRKEPRHQQVQVVIMSAKDSHHDMKYGYKLGANFYLPKPLQPERLRRALEMLRTQAGLLHPRKKALSKRDVELRLATGMSTAFASSADQATPAGDSSNSMRLRRPLAEDEDKEGKHWVG